MVAICDSGIRITWVQVSRLPVPHLDNDRWKHTTFTNKTFIFQYVLVTRSHQLTYIQDETIQHDGIIIIMIVMCKNDKYVHSEPHRSTRLAIKAQLFSVRESGN